MAGQYHVPKSHLCQLSAKSSCDVRRDPSAPGHQEAREVPISSRVPQAAASPAASKAAKANDPCPSQRTESQAAEVPMAHSAISDGGFCGLAGTWKQGRALLALLTDSYAHGQHMLQSSQEQGCRHQKFKETLLLPAQTRKVLLTPGVWNILQSSGRANTLTCDCFAPCYRCRSKSQLGSEGAS